MVLLTGYVNPMWSQGKISLLSVWVFSLARSCRGAAHQHRIKSAYAPIKSAQLLYGLSNDRMGILQSNTDDPTE